jgi:hypothetical protein
LTARPGLPYGHISVIADSIKEVKALIWAKLAASNRIKSSVPFGWLLASLLTCGLVLYAPSNAHADDDAPPPAPRTVIIIGDASVSLIAANDQLYAFVDRLDDNTPVSDAELSVEINDRASITPAWVPIAMNRAAAGRFIGPLKRAGRQHDAFVVSLQSSAGSGDAPAEIIYYLPVVVNSAYLPPPATSMSTTLPIAGVSGIIGAVVVAILTFSWGGWRQRGTASTVGTGRAE